MMKKILAYENENDALLSDYGTGKLPRRYSNF